MKTLVVTLVATFLAVLASHGAEYSDILYANVLKAYVRDGQIDYARLTSDRTDLDNYIHQLGQITPAQYSSWSDNGRIAFLLNAYNALTLQVIVDHYPLKSILDLKEKNVSVWDRLKFPVAGEELSLNDIEHRKLREQFNEPRIHMALVCASTGCPPLRDEPFRGEELGSQLDEQSMAFLQSPKNFAIDAENSVVYLSAIFDWFGDDFTKSYGDVRVGHRLSPKWNAALHFALPYLRPEQQKFLAIGEYTVTVLKYDWSLNRQ